MILDRTYLQQTFPDLETRTVLDLANQSISFIALGTFEGLASLQWLVLGENQLTQIATGMFAGLASLQRLDLHKNQLTQIAPGAFKGLANLQGLYLGENQLTQIAPDTFKGLASLQRLDLHKNQLTQIAPGAFKGLASLQRLYLDGNQLTQIAPGTFDGVPSQFKVILDRHLAHPNASPFWIESVSKEITDLFPDGNLHEALSSVAQLKKLSAFTLSKDMCPLTRRLILFSRYVHHPSDLGFYRFHSMLQLQDAFHVRSKLAQTATIPLRNMPMDVVRYICDF